MKFLHGTCIGLCCLMAGFLVAWQAWPTQAQGADPAAGKPALYDFGRGMCIPCMEMEKILASVKSKYGNQIEVRLVMAEKNEELFKKYKVMLIPTQVFLDASGKEVFRHVGLFQEKDLLAKLKELKFIK
jgi:thioredoxin 1